MSGVVYVHVYEGEKEEEDGRQSNSGTEVV